MDNPSEPYNVTAHDGDKLENRTSLQIFKLGEESKEGDDVLSYRNGTGNFALKGTREESEGKKIWVKYFNFGVL